MDVSKHEASGKPVHRERAPVAAVSMLGGKGLPLVQQRQFKNGRYSYIDSGPQLGVLLELLENTGEKS